MRISDWSSDVCSSDLDQDARHGREMHHGVNSGRSPACLQPIETEMHGKRVEHLAAIREGGCKRIDPRAIQRREIGVQELMRSEERRVGKERVRTVKSWWGACI